MVSEAVALQRVDAEARIAFRRRGARTVLADLHACGGARLVLPRGSPDGWTEAVLINTAGGLTGGILLLALPGSVFRSVVPLLILAACVLVALQPRG